MLYAIIGVLVIIADQAVKYLSLARVGMLGDVVPLIPNVISLVYVENRGAAFGFLAGSNARIFFIILTGVFTLAVIIALATKFISGRLSRWCMVLVTAGGLSNCIDRVIYGYVQDMFKVELFNFAVFNLADVFITFFCFLFILCILFGGEKNRSVANYDEFDDDDDDEEEEEKRPLFGKIARGRDDDDFDEPRREKKAKRREPDIDDAPRSKRQAAVADVPPSPQRIRRGEASQAGVQRAQSIQQSQATRPSVQRTPAPAPAKIPSAPVVGSADPFAEWEKANARVSGQNSTAAKAMGVTPAKAPIQQPEPRPVSPVQAPAKTPASPVSRPTGASRSSSDFDLDEILNEFK